MFFQVARLSHVHGRSSSPVPMRPFRLLAAALAVLALSAAPAFAKSRIKDIVEFEGVRDNMLVGYGIVVGLSGTGDALRNAPMTKQSLEAMLERLGVNTRDANLNTKNVAAVMVTAKLPSSAVAENPTIVAIHPVNGDDMMSFVAQVENLDVEPDAPAKVVIDEVAGVIVIGENVRVSTVAIQQGNLTITVQETPAVSQPAPF